MMRVVCNFLHDASRTHSRKRMQRWQAKVVPYKSALMEVVEQLRWTVHIISLFKQELSTDQVPTFEALLLYKLCKSP